MKTPAAPDLTRLLRPRSIAVCGGAWARNVEEQCAKMGFAGEIWTVNPRRAAAGEPGCFSSIADLPRAPDAAFVGVNREAAIEAVAELARAGAGGAVCFAAGFGEAGRGELENRLVAAAGAMPLVGPNCYGVINYFDGAPLWPDQQGGRRETRGAAFVSQSSNLAINITMQTRGLPLGYVVCAGNQAQLDAAAIARGLLEDPRVTCLGFYLEGIKDARAFAATVARAREMKKPVVVLRAGKTESSRAAAVSHTASLAGESAAASAFLRRCGAAEVDTLSELIETLKLLHAHGEASGRRLATLSCSGGEACLIADLARDKKIEWPHPPDADALFAHLQKRVKIANPLDYHTFIWGDLPGMRGVFSRMMNGFDLTMLVLDFPNARGDDALWRDIAANFAAAAAEKNARGAVASILPESMPEDVARDLFAAGVAPLSGIDEALTAFEKSANLPPLNAAHWLPLAPAPAADTESCDDPESRGEDEAKRWLRAAGIEIPANAVAATPTEAAAAAGEMRGRLVLKGLGFAHKTEAGAVVLDPPRAEIAARAAQMKGARGFLVEEMITGGVAEILLCARRDPVFGVVLTVGAGGELAELLRDVATLIWPATAAEILAAVESLAVAGLLRGHRGRAAGDAQALADCAQKIAVALAADSDAIEIEINPLIVLPVGRGAVAVDALLQKRKTR